MRASIEKEARVTTFQLCGSFPPAARLLELNLLVAEHPLT